MKEIFLTPKEKRALRDKFNVCYGTVDNALKCKTKSFLTAKIREAAIEMGGAMRIVKEENSAVDEQTNNSTNEPEECTN